MFEIELVGHHHAQSSGRSKSAVHGKQKTNHMHKKATNNRTQGYICDGYNLVYDQDLTALC